MESYGWIVILVGLYCVSSTFLKIKNTVQDFRDRLDRIENEVTRNGVR